jgi:flavin-dependent dehydrogenase
MATCSRPSDRPPWSPDPTLAASYHLTIVGGGPAGSVLALLSARRGMRVLLAERPRSDRRKLGETVPSEIKPTLARLGLAHVLEGPRHREAPAIASVWGSADPAERSYITSPYGNALHLDRHAFDDSLAHAARTAGADLRVAQIIRFEPRARGGYDVITSTGQRTATGLVALAGGRCSRGCGLPYVRRHLDDHAAVAARLESSTAQQEHRTLIEAIPGGWFYLAPLANGHIVVVLVTSAMSIPGGRAERRQWWLALLARTTMIRSSLVGCRLPTELSVCDARASFASTPAGVSWFAIGDARLAPDPLSGCGIIWALDDAIAAAQAMAETSPHHMAAAMMERTRRDVADYRAGRARAYAEERRFPHDPYWQSRAGAG